jgi:hypothetical protein
MPEIGMSVSMSGDGKRGVGHRPQATAPILDSTGPAIAPMAKRMLTRTFRRNLFINFTPV